MSFQPFHITDKGELTAIVGNRLSGTLVNGTKVALCHRRQNQLWINEAVLFLSSKRMELHMSKR